MNKLFIIGNLTKPPETRTTNSGKSVCTFTVAVSRRFPVNGEKVTDYFRTNAWGALGENCAKYLDKGKKVAIVGELQPRLYEANDGSTRMSLEISADEVEFLSPRGDRGADNEPTVDENGFTNLTDEDLPF